MAMVRFVVRASVLYQSKSEPTALPGSPLQKLLPRRQEIHENQVQRFQGFLASGHLGQEVTNHTLN